MYKTLSIVATLLLAVGLAVAQDQSNPSSNPSSSSAQSSSQTPSSADQSAPASSQSSTDQSATSSQSGTAADQNAAPSTADQNAAAGGRSGKLPQTASPLPLIALLGMGSLTAGLVSRRKKAGNEAWSGFAVSSFLLRETRNEERETRTTCPRGLTTRSATSLAAGPSRTSWIAQDVRWGNLFVCGVCAVREKRSFLCITVLLHPPRLRGEKTFKTPCTIRVRLV